MLDHVCLTSTRWVLARRGRVTPDPARDCIFWSPRHRRRVRRLPGQLPERGDDRFPRAVDQRFLLRSYDACLAVHDVARQLFERAFTRTLAALVDEQAVSGQRRKPAQLAAHAVALLVDGEFEPRAERKDL